jgi:hypothetical protein
VEKYSLTTSIIIFLHLFFTAVANSPQNKLSRSQRAMSETAETAGTEGNKKCFVTVHKLISSTLHEKKINL